MRTSLADSELICNADGSIYHLALQPGELAERIILVGDPDRVPKVSRQFDSIELTRQKRELITHTGYYQGKRFSVISTGMSTGNIDIVVNEIDALFNVDFNKREIKPTLTSLTLVRIGTCGGLQADVPTNGTVVSSSGIGFDALMHCYDIEYNKHEQALTDAITTHCQDYANQRAFPYVCEGCPDLIQAFSQHGYVGLTATCGGFYGPQGRQIRLKPQMKDFLDVLQQFNFEDERIANFEMETSALYGIGKALGHRCLTVATVVANRVTGEFSRDSAKAIDQLIEVTLSQLSA